MKNTSEIDSRRQQFEQLMADTFKNDIGEYAFAFRRGDYVIPCVSRAWHTWQQTFADQHGQVQ